MNATGKLAGKTALVTGGGRGLGRGIAEIFAAEGAKLVINYLRDEASAQAVAKTIADSGGEAIAVQADIGDAASVQAMTDAALARFGAVDILVNNAGMLNAGPIATMAVEVWDEMIRVHLRGMFLCTRAMLPQMIARGSGRIINMTGTFGICGGADFAHMSAAKGGMIAFTRALAREVGPQGITVNAIAPAIIRTDLYNFMPDDVRKGITDTYPLRRVGEVEDVASTALFLAAKDGDFFTGQTLCPAGGDVMV